MRGPATAFLFLALALGFDASRAGAAASDPYAFTDSACVKGAAFGTAQQTCNLLPGPVIAGASTTVFVTALSSGVPAERSSSSSTTVPMAFALSCVNPASHANVHASYAGVPLQLCTPNGGVPGLAAWSGFVNVVFAAGAPSAGASFVYADVGKVQLLLNTSGGIVGSAPFVVKPAALKITSVTRMADGSANPQATSGTGAAFARAGEALKITAAAQNSDGTAAPNFGSENMVVVLDGARGGDAAAQGAMLALPTLSGSFASIINGVSTGDAFSVDEAGILALTPRLCNKAYTPQRCDNDYLGAGPPPLIETINVGRIYPDHFDTSTAVTLACLPHMNCPAGVGAAAYSGQPFAVTVTPMNAQGAALKNFNGVFARPITLSAFTQPGGTVSNGAGVLSANTVPLASIVAPIVANPVYTFPLRFSSASPQAGNWTAPSAAFLRADVSDGAGSVSSLRTVGSVEAGMMIVNGRLALENPHGSELAKMPVRAVAQYWTGAKRWEPSASDSVSTLQSGGIAFSNCRKGLQGDCGSPTLGVTANSLLTLSNGAATFWLRAPGAGKTGSADFQMNNPAWLPSTLGRAVFGVYTSPLIYLREVY